MFDRAKYIIIFAATFDLRELQRFVQIEEVKLATRATGMFYYVTNCLGSLVDSARMVAIPVVRITGLG